MIEPHDAAMESLKQVVDGELTSLTKLESLVMQEYIALLRTTNRTLTRALEKADAFRKAIRLMALTNASTMRPISTPPTQEDDLDEA